MAIPNVTQSGESEPSVSFPNGSGRSVGGSVSGKAGGGGQTVGWASSSFMGPLFGILREKPPLCFQNGGIPSISIPAVSGSNPQTVRRVSARSPFDYR